MVFKINYELFNRNSFSIHSWSWNYRGCWHQTCPPIVTPAHLCRALIPIANYICNWKHRYLSSLPRRPGTE